MRCRWNCGCRRRIAGLRIVEVPVPLIYLEEKRSFGGSLDDGAKRLEYYHQVLDRAIAATKDNERLHDRSGAAPTRLRGHRMPSPPRLTTTVRSSHADGRSCSVPASASARKTTARRSSSRRDRLCPR